MIFFLWRSRSVSLYLNPPPRGVWKPAINKSFMNKWHNHHHSSQCSDCNRHSQPLGGCNSIGSSSPTTNVLFPARVLLQLSGSYSIINQVEQCYVLSYSIKQVEQLITMYWNDFMLSCISKLYRLITWPPASSASMESHHCSKIVINFVPLLLEIY